MKTPVWEESPGALAALLLTKQFAQCDLHTWKLAGGAGTIRIAAADVALTYPGGPLWPSDGPQVDLNSSRSTGHWKRGLDVDTWQTVVMARPVDPITGAAFPDKIGSVPWNVAARQGALDGADYQVDRAYFAAWPVPFQPVFIPVGIITIFAGLTAEVDVADTLVSIMSNDYRILLGKQLPRNVYQAGCRYTLFDAGCTLDANAFKVSGTLEAGSTRSSLKVSAVVPPGSDTFSLGRVVMTSGLNATFARTIASWDNGQTFGLLNPLPFDVAEGDTFDAFPGCDKTQATCTKFANLANFGGQSFIPAPETAI
jgi:hypothetical protein